MVDAPRKKKEALIINVEDKKIKKRKRRSYFILKMF